MALGDSSVSDKNLVLETTDLARISNEWKSTVLSANLGSIDITGKFSPLMKIIPSFLNDLKKALVDSEQNALNIASLISSTAVEQEETDNAMAKESESNDYSYFAKTSTTGGSNYSGNNTSGVVSATPSYTKPEINTSFEANNNNLDVEINTNIDIDKIEFKEEDLLEIVAIFEALYKGDISALFDTNIKELTGLKEQLLASPNISDAAKTEITKLDNTILKTYLQKVYLSGKTVSNFSKLIVTVFDSQIKKDNKDLSVYDSSKKISTVYSKLAKSEDYQKELQDLYFGSSTIEDADDNVIYFTRTFVDTLATASNVTYEDVLTSPKFKDTLYLGIHDLANTFTVVSNANDVDTKVKSALYSNLIVKQEG